LVLAIVFGIVSFILDFELGTQGFIGLAFFIIVMFAGAFKKGSTISKRFKSIRKEYSILGFVVLLPHAVKYLIQFLDGSYHVEWYGIIAMVVMIPLFITSFTVIKKKMNIKKWYELQRWAYLAYAGIFLHLLMIGEKEHTIAYIVIFGLYSLLKFKNDIFNKENKQYVIFKSVIVTVLIVLGSLVITGNIGNLVYKAETIDLSLVEDGTYTGKSDGFQNLPISLEVTVLDGEIIDINIIEYGSTSPHKGINFYDEADNMSDNIISTQDTGIDSISGATTTTKGIQEAIIDALS